MNYCIKNVLKLFEIRLFFLSCVSVQFSKFEYKRARKWKCHVSESTIKNELGSNGLDLKLEFSKLKNKIWKENLNRLLKKKIKTMVFYKRSIKHEKSCKTLSSFKEGS